MYERCGNFSGKMGNHIGNHTKKMVNYVRKIGNFSGMMGNYVGKICKIKTCYHI